MANRHFFVKACVSFGKSILFLLSCVLLSFLIVFPLWKFALSFPKAYTIFASALLLSFVILKLAGIIKKAGKKKFFKTLAQIFIILAGLGACVSLVLTGHRIFALLVLIILPFLHLGVTSVFFKETT